MKDGRVSDRLRIFIVIASEPLTLSVDEGGDERRIRISGLIYNEALIGRKERSVGCHRVEVRTSQHLALRESFEIQAGNDTKIVAPTAKRPVEVWVGVEICVGYLTIGQDNLRDSGFASQREE